MTDEYKLRTAVGGYKLHCNPILRAVGCPTALQDNGVDLTGLLGGT